MTHSPAGRFVCDVTTSYRYKGANAVGIVRVEREIARAMLRSHYDCSFVRFDAEVGVFYNLSMKKIDQVLGLQNNDAVSIAESDIEFIFDDECVLISAGLSWDQPYSHLIYQLKKKYSLRFVQVVYDVIPTIMPEFCVPDMEAKFTRFILDTLWTADAIFCISDHTAADVRTLMGKFGSPQVPLFRISMGADNLFTEKSVREPVLEPGRFVLYVSSIEPRKNHITALHTWRSLNSDLGDYLFPLIIVGKQQWNSADIMAFISQSSVLNPDYIKILDHVDDEKLGWLYKHAAYTIYPSLYEGWGLPISESLMHGTPCVASNTSSMPEAAQGLCDLLHPLNQPEWVRVCHLMQTNPRILQERRTEIQRRFHLPSWSESTDSFIETLVNQI